MPNLPSPGILLSLGIATAITTSVITAIAHTTNISNNTFDNNQDYLEGIMARRMYGSLVASLCLAAISFGATYILCANPSSNESYSRLERHALLIIFLSLMMLSGEVALYLNYQKLLSEFSERGISESNIQQSILLLKSAIGIETVGAAAATTNAWFIRRTQLAIQKEDEEVTRGNNIALGIEESRKVVFLEMPGGEICVGTGFKNIDPNSPPEKIWAQLEQAGAKKAKEMALTSRTSPRPSNR